MSTDRLLVCGDSGHIGEHLAAKILRFYAAKKEVSVPGVERPESAVNELKIRAVDEQAHIFIQAGLDAGPSSLHC